MSAPLVAHLDSAFVQVMDEVQDRLRYALQTENRRSIPVIGTGSASMETAFANVVELVLAALEEGLSNQGCEP